LLVYDLNI